MTKNKRAIIIGFSWTGKLAARVLSDVFQEVIVIERDARPKEPKPRKGIPQSHQPHVLLKKGEELLNSLFPNVTEELIQEGAVTFDFMKDVQWVHHGRQKVRVESHFRQLSLSRPLLEWVIQTRLEKVVNLKVCYDTEVKGLIWERNNKVTGVKITSKNHPKPEMLEADLVVDASGVAAHFMHALRNSDRPVPIEETLEMNLAYTSQKVHLSPSGSRNWQAFLLYPTPPKVERGGIIYPLENGEWIISLFGYGGDHCEAKKESFLEFAKTLSSPVFSEAIEQSSPLSDLKTYKIPKQYRRRMDKLHALPEGLLVMGDALCRFDPVFGQGMTAACLEAEVLQNVMRNSRHIIGSTPFNRVVYKQFMRRLFPLWLMVLTEDFRYEKTKGKKPLGLRFLQHYIYGIYSVSETDPYVYRQFSRVLHLLDSPFGLFSPRVLFKVLIKGNKPKKNAG